VSGEGPDLEPGEQARADSYRLLGALLVAPPDAAMLDRLRAIRPAADADDAVMTAAWQELELVPYASFYIHGLLMEKVLASLREELAGLGIERQAGVAEPEDHAAAVCEIMGMIISGHGLHCKQSAFFEDYVGSWLGNFFTDLGAAEAAGFYRAVAQLGQQFLAVEQRYFSLPE
jgi:TorA maturation chaperone TorD